MKEITKAKRTKTIYRLGDKEFREGKWLEHIPKGDLYVVEYKRKSEILIIHNAEIKRLDTKEEE